MKQVRFKNLFLWLSLVLVAAAFLLVQVWKQNQYIALVRTNGELERQIKSLKSDVANIRLDHKSLKSFTRLETIGREHFGFVYPETPAFVYPETEKKEAEPVEVVLGWFHKKKDHEE